jgi:hypothetical protein
MNLENIKRNISREISQMINTIDPAFELDTCLNLYFKVLNCHISIPIKDDLDGLENSILKTLVLNYDEQKTDFDSIGNFCKNFEQFVKKVYYIIEQTEFIEDINKLDRQKLHPLLTVLSKLNKVKPYYLDENNNEVFDFELAEIIEGKPKRKKDSDNGDIIYKKLYPTSITFDKYSDMNDSALNLKYQNTFNLYLIKSVLLKNEQSHQAPLRSKIENLVNLNTTLITELWIVNFFKKELNFAIKKENYKKRDWADYIDIEINRLSKIKSKFVSLSLKKLDAKSNNLESGLIEDLLEENKFRMRILGHGGSGKTSTLEYLVFKDAENWQKNVIGAKLPVILYLASVKSNETIVESIAKKLNTSIEDVEEILETNEINIYLDGANEIVEYRESKKQKLQEISNLIDDHPLLSIVITDRFEFDSYQNNMFNVPTYMIQKLDKVQVEEFVIKYCANSSDQAALVLKVLETKNNIIELLQKPLILTRAIEIIKIENNLPEKEGQIIEKFIDILLKREKDEKKDPLLNVKNIKLILSYAANEIYQKNKTNAAIHEDRFNKLLIDASEKFGLERSNAGYVSRIGYELEILLKIDDLIQFYHQSYFDFFCSCYLIYEIR